MISGVCRLIICARETCPGKYVMTYQISKYSSLSSSVPEDLVLGQGVGLSLFHTSEKQAHGCKTLPNKGCMGAELLRSSPKCFLAQEITDSLLLICPGGIEVSLTALLLSGMGKEKSSYDVTREEKAAPFHFGLVHY